MPYEGKLPEWKERFFLKAYRDRVFNATSCNLKEEETEALELLALHA